MTITVTKTFVPRFEEYTSYLEEIWERRWLTNHGPLSETLIGKLKDCFGVKHLFFVSNGTVALQLAIRALGLRGEVITTPFSYVASASSIYWENCLPRFADIDPRTCCLDPSRVEDLVGQDTAAILPVHVYGNCCAVEEIGDIAKRRGLKVIYDGAHAFSSRLQGRSILQYGDIATISFHATKLFHTAEGGALMTSDDDLAHRISYLMNFGHNGPEAFFGLGVNGKNSELHAALGLAVLPYVPVLIEARKERSLLYDSLFAGLLGERLRRPCLREHLDYNYSYYPIFFPSEALLLKVREALRAQDIVARRYFYPSLTRLPYVGQQQAPTAEDLSGRVLCLPLYHDLPLTTVEQIAGIVMRAVTGQRAGPVQ